MIYSFTLSKVGDLLASVILTGWPDREVRLLNTHIITSEMYGRRRWEQGSQELTQYVLLFRIYHRTQLDIKGEETSDNAPHAPEDAIVICGALVYLLVLLL